VVADDLIWATRLGQAVREAGFEAVAFRSPAELAPAIEALDAVIVDLSHRTAAVVEAIELASGRGRPALAVGPHDDGPLRDAARHAGAERVLAYRAIHASGGAAIGRWLAGLASAEAAATAEAPETAETAKAPKTAEAAETARRTPMGAGR
jgi:hypothetical protein